MTVVRGRANRGAGWVLRAVVCAAFGILTLGAGGCGNSTLTYGTNVITFSSVPGNFFCYLAYVTAVTLKRNDGTVVEPLAVRQRVDFTKLADISELFGAPAVIEGTYSSGTITVDYTSAAIEVNVGGAIKTATVVDTTGATAGSVTYNITFDPAHPLVIKHGVSTPMDLNFDLPASTVIDTSTAIPKVTVRPFMSTNTAPTYTKPIRARGLFVTAKNSPNSFVVNTRSFDDISSNPFGSLEIIVSPQTLYYVNGVTYTGPPGLAALSTLQLNESIAAYGSLTNLNLVTPTFTATTVYAGISQDSPIEDRIIGTVSERTATSLNLTGALILTGLGQIDFSGNIPVTVSDSTLVSIDGRGGPNVTPDVISVGQQVTAGGTLVYNTTTGVVQSLNAATGLIRLNQTTAWGTLTNATSGSATLDLVTLGGYSPSLLKFTGTGSVPTDYQLNTGSVNAGTSTGTLVRADGIVSPYGTAPPDFTATAITPASATEQVLEIDWTGTGSTAPFVTLSASGTVVNMSDAHLGTAHVVHIGPTNVDLTNPRVNVTIVAAPGAVQFAFGNPTTATGLTSYNTFAGFISKVNTQLNGTNALQKLVAVGQYDAATSTFTAQRVDIVQVQ